MHELWVVIPSFDDLAMISRCLGELHPNMAPYTVCVVDHGSVSTIELLQRDFPSVETVRETPELWWTGATNAGIRRALDAGASHVMLLNSDCVVDKATVNRLWDLSREMSPGVVAPLQRNLHDRQPLVVRSWTGLSAGFPTLRSERRVRKHGVVPTRMIIGGRGVIIPRQIFEQVGLFDADALPHYLADHDFYLRCRRAGYSLFVDTESQILVDQERSTESAQLGRLDLNAFRATLSSRRSHRNLRDLRTFFERNYPVRRLWRIGYTLSATRYCLAWMAARAVRLGRTSRQPPSDG